MPTEAVRNVWLLPLLKKPYAEVVADLASSLAGLGFPDIDPQAVSLRDLLSLALNCGEAYWARLAVRWLTEGFPLDAGSVGQADRLVREKHIPQSTRHEAFRLARRWERRQRS